MKTHPGREWIEGPHIRFKDHQSVQLLYLKEEGAEVKEQPVAPEAQLIKLDGIAAGGEHQHYVLMRTPQAATAEQEGVARILMVGDMHGQLSKLVRLLQAHRVIDEERNWRWGRGHLVMCGDVMDRGMEVLPLLWLLCKLEQQAQEAGGALHLLLGNHELMVLQGDYRYVNPNLMQRYALSGMEYGKLFGKDWYLGQWLRSRHAVVRLNGLLISHAGISAATAHEGLNIAALNASIRAAIDKRSLTDLEELLLGNLGPLWYRGYLMKNPYYSPATEQEVGEVLEQFSASHMVVAHTTVDRIKSFFGGSLWAVDLDIESPAVAAGALLFEEGKFYVLSSDGGRTQASGA
ncbi:metallophosphoesterase [Cesiribacter sp. SM1]|uniref:metallophosphoesterase n=1 Tax=Cesiribacter sp. SM1 TaxID=2861196 RepID=UPI001CD3CBFE|nr:metallophosphoesterase [Cesiribacter sp. SM1]